jgi:hypothetical protein
VAPLAELWDGSRWTIEPVPSSSSAKTSTLFSVSCAALTHCVAVGRTESALGAFVPLAELWDGTRWTAMQPVPAPDGEADLAAVSCSAPAACLAVGTARRGFNGRIGAFAEVWDGSSWRIVADPGSSRVGLRAVSCISASDCLAAGDGLLAWDGTHLGATSDPAGARVSAISCTPSGCAVAGSRGRHRAAAAWYQVS